MIDSAANDPVIKDSRLDHLLSRLQGQLGGRVRNLHLISTDSGLILRGHTRTYYAKQLAQHAVMTETKVPILANEIVVC